MNEHPILFSAPMIRALQRGTKTQTRRLVKPIAGVGGVPLVRLPRQQSAIYLDDTLGLAWAPYSGSGMQPWPAERIGEASPYGGPGDRLWVRETWAPQPGREDSVDLPEHDGGGNPDALCFRADECRPGESTEWPEGLTFGVRKWRPSIFMPRWGSRLTLNVIGARVERLQSITPADILAEGVVARSHDDPNLGKCPVSSFDGKAYVDLRSLWAAGWDSINGKRAPWASNPWVWVVEFAKGIAS